MKDKMMVMTSWLDKFNNICNEEQQKEICYRILRYGLYGENVNSEDAVVNLAMNFIVPQIDNMQESYSKKVAAGNSYGRPKVADDVAIWKLAREGKNGRKIAEELGINDKTVYSSRGWKCRKMDTFDSENFSEF